MSRFHFWLRICTILVFHRTFGDGHPVSSEVEADQLNEDMSVKLNHTTGPSSYDQNDVRRPTPFNRGLYLAPEGSTLWPGGKVYYRFEKKDKKQVLEEKYRIYFTRAMNAITGATNSCIQFIEDKNATRTSGVIIYRKTNKKVEGGIVSYEDSCFSECLGQCKGKTQEVVVTPDHCDNFKGNYAGSIAHELMHVLGFGHEFMRNDRDKYITVNDKEYKKGFGTSFYAHKALADDTKGLPFDFKSITQYNLASVTTEKKNPPAKPDGKPKNMGQECRISAGDRNLIELTYAPLCRSNKKPQTTYKRNFIIVGTDCNSKIDLKEVDYVDE